MAKEAAIELGLLEPKLLWKINGAELVDPAPP